MFFSRFTKKFLNFHWLLSFFHNLVNNWSCAHPLYGKFFERILASGLHLVQELKLNNHQARHMFSEWTQNEMANDPDFHKEYLFSDETHF